MNNEKHYTQQELNAMSNEQLRLDRQTLENIKTQGESSIPAFVWVILFTLVIVLFAVFVWVIGAVAIVATLISIKCIYNGN